MAGPRAWIGVAYSGGRDSGALLHAAVQVCAPLGVGIHALHVHHGLLSDADAWLAHCAARCEGYAGGGHAVGFSAHRLTERPPRGASVEAWAREQRYAALAAMARALGIDLVLLAHHRRDQAETFLLQALRGAGVAGLAAMPRQVVRDGITWARPWLSRPREAIEAYARHTGLDAVTDPSNSDPQLARARLRGVPWAALTASFPDAESSLATSAGWAAQAAALFDELAAADLAALRDGGTLPVGAWQALSPLRRTNALRAWLHRQIGGAAPATLVLRLLAELPTAGAARWPVPGGELRLHRGKLRLAAAPGTCASAAAQSILLRRAGTYAVPAWHGRLRLRRVAEGGVALAALADAELRPRQGGERFQAGVGRPPRSLKKQFQGAGLDAWQRNGPLLYAADRLVFVPGLGIDARMRAAAGEPQVALDWLPIPES